MISAISLYVVQMCVEDDGPRYFAGFDRVNQVTVKVADIKKAKFYTNKNDIKLRKDEFIVELSVSLNEQSIISISEPFVPTQKKAFKPVGV